MSLSPLYHVLTNDLHVSTARPTSIAVSSDFVVTRHRSPPFGSYRTLLPLDGLSGGHPSCRWSLRTGEGVSFGIMTLSCPHNNNFPSSSATRRETPVRCFVLGVPRSVEFAFTTRFLLYGLCAQDIVRALASTVDSLARVSRREAPCLPLDSTEGFFPLSFGRCLHPLDERDCQFFFLLFRLKSEHIQTIRRDVLFFLLSSGEREPRSVAITPHRALPRLRSEAPLSGLLVSAEGGARRRWTGVGGVPTPVVAPAGSAPGQLSCFFNMPTPYFSAPLCPPLSERRRECFGTRNKVRDTLGARASSRAHRNVNTNLLRLSPISPFSGLNRERLRFIGVHWLSLRLLEPGGKGSCFFAGKVFFCRPPLSPAPPRSRREKDGLFVF